MKKKITSLVLAILVLVCVPQIHSSASSSMIIDGPASNYNVGNTFDASFELPNNYHGRVHISYDSSVISAQNISQEAGGSDGAYDVNLYGSSSVSVKFKAVGAGTTSLRVTCDDVTSNDGTQEITDVPSGAGVSITVSNSSDDSNSSSTTTDSNSGDNSLSSLTLSAGSLSPAFKYNVTNYTATVDYSVTDVAISATCSNAAASIVSVEGNEGLKVGDNTVAITVKAGNGVTATYKIVITRLSEEESNKTEEPASEETPVSSDGSEEFNLNGITYVPASQLPEEGVPADFTATTIAFGGVEYPALSFNNGSLTVLYMVQKDSEDAAGGYFIYDADSDSIYQFVKLTTENHYVICLLPSAADVPENYTEYAITIDGKGTIAGYRKVSTEESENATETSWFGPMIVNAAEVDENDFYYIYCMNDRGETSWYRYDVLEGTFQRATLDTSDDTVENASGKLQDKLDAATARNRYLIIGMIMGFAILLVIIVNLILANRDLKQGVDDEDEFDDADSDETAFMEEDDSEENSEVDSNSDSDDNEVTETNEMAVSDSDTNESEANEPELNVAEDIQSEEERMNQLEADNEAALLAETTEGLREALKEFQKDKEDANELTTEDNEAAFEQMVESLGEKSSDDETLATDAIMEAEEELPLGDNRVTLAAEIENEDSETDLEEEKAEPELEEAAMYAEPRKKRGFWGFFSKKEDDFWAESEESEEEEAEDEDSETVLADSVAESIQEDMEDKVDKAIKTGKTGSLTANLTDKLTAFAHGEAKTDTKNMASQNKQPEPEEVLDFMDSILSETMEEVKADLKKEEKIQIQKAPIVEEEESDMEDDDLEFLDL